MNRPRAVIYFITFFLISFFSCTQVDPVGKGYYHIDNRSERVLTLEATSIHQTEIEFSPDTIAPGSIVKFYSVIECSGGHVRPSNFFSEFKVFAIVNGMDSLIYQGVNDNDWEFREEGQEDGQNYYLIIQLDE